MNKQELAARLRLYLICGEGFSPEENIAAVKAALKGGVTAVQLRVKSWDAATAFQCALSLKALCSAANALFFVNDRIDIALAAAADGVHLGQKDIPVDAARRIAGKDFIIGGTARTAELAKRAQKLGADYIGCGAAFATGTKNDAVIIGPSGIRMALCGLSIPSVAIGGIDAGNLSLLEGCGADGAALSGSIMRAADPYSAALELSKTANIIFKKEA